MEISPKRGKQYYQDTKNSKLVAEGQNGVRSLRFLYISAGN